MSDLPYWNEKYREQKQRLDTQPEIEIAALQPSSFAEFCVDFLRPGEPVMDVGCGNGRDSLYFARQGHPVLGVDGAAGAIEYCNALVAHLPGVPMRFHQGAFPDYPPAVLTSLAKLQQTANTCSVYARFFLHALSEPEQLGFLTFVQQLSGAGTRLCLEFRVLEDAALHKQTGQHFRRFLQQSEVRAALQACHFEILFATQGQGLAVYGDEDAFVCRLIAECGHG